MTNLKLQINPKYQILNYKCFGFGAWFLFVIWNLVLVIFPFSASAGLVPCTGVNCTICDFFKLFQNIFNTSLVIVPVVAVIFIAIGGYYFLIAGGDPGKVTKARKILKDTFIGIVIFYSSYVLASFAVGFFARSSGGIDFGFRDGGFTFSCSGGEIENKIGTILDGGRITISIPGEPTRTSRVDIVGELIIERGVDIVNLDSDVRSKLNEVSRDNVLDAQGIRLLVTSGKRSVQEQQELVAQYCPVGATRSDECEPETCIPRDASGSNCNHINGKAVDVHGSQGGLQCADDSACQRDVIEAMKIAGGFCVLKSESWHFELESQISDSRKSVFNCPLPGTSDRTW